MKLQTIAFGRTLSDKDFGSFRVDVTAELSEGDCVQSCMNELKEFAIRNVNADLLSVKDPAQQELAVDPVVEDTPKKAAKKVAKKAAKKVAKKVVKKKATTPYDRTLQVHRDIFLELSSNLGMRKPNMSDDEKQALKATSLHMEGKDMFEAGTTTVLNDFKLTSQAFHLASLGSISNDV
jgi:hypothetical protein